MLSVFLQHKTKIVITLLIFLFFAIAYYIYNIYVIPRINAKYVSNKEFIPENSSTSKVEYAELVLFHTTWCPHSKSAMKVWEKFKEKMNNITINKHTLIFKEVDCEEDEATADKYNITGYPTIKLIKSEDEIVEFDAKPTLDTLKEFVHTVL